MASSTLCQQNQNKQQDYSGILKTHNEHRKAPSSVKVSKPSTVHHGSKRGSENQDPSAPERGASTVNKLKGVSRLPVLAKSLQQPATTDPTQIKWEERPLLGKEKRKKTCTKPQPFGLSQPRVSRLRTQRQEQTSLENTGKVRTLPGAQPTQPPAARTQSTLRPKPKTCETKLAGPGTFCGTSMDTGSLSAQTATPSGKTAGQCHNVLSRLKDGDLENQTSDSLSTLGCPVPGSTATDKTTTQLDVSKDISTHLGGISLASSKRAASAKDDGLSKAQSHKTPFRTPHAAPQRVAVQTKTQTAQSTPSVHKPDNTTDGFCPDPSALRSILQSEGVTASGLPGTTPRPSLCPSGRTTSVYLPQRVSVLKSAQRPKAEANTGMPQTFTPDPGALNSILSNTGIQPGGLTPHGSACPPGRATSIYKARRVPVAKSRAEGGTAAQKATVTFSPDSAALSSILQNEGIKAGGATPRASACPSGRGNSICTAQRVPVTKSRTEMISASLGPARSSPSGVTPPVKWTPLRVPNTKPQSMKRLLSAYRTPKFSGSPGLRGVQPSSSEPPSQKEDDVVQRLFEEHEEEDKMEDEKEQHAVLETREHPESEPEAEPLAAPEAEMSGPQQGSSAAHETGGQGPFLQSAARESVIVLCSGQRLFGQTPSRGAASCTAQEPRLPSAQPVGSLPGLLHQPSGSKVTTSLESAIPTKATPLCEKRVLELRRRLPSLEEMMLDEECAIFMSQPQYCASFPRCSNPVASTLLFQDSTCFLPIGLASPSPAPCPV